MQFIKNLFKNDSVIGLSGLRKKREFVAINIPEAYKKTYIPNTDKNYFLI
jgi:hypothetical protein